MVCGFLFESRGLTVVEVAMVGGRLRLLPPAIAVVVVGFIRGAVKALTRLSTSPVVAVVVVVDGLGRGRGFTVVDNVDVEGGGNGLVETVTACLGGDFKRESKRMSF